MVGIHPNDAAARQLIKTYPKNFDYPVLIPEEKYKFPVDLAIYDDRVGYMSSEKDGSAIIIENKDIANVMKNIFDLAYQEAKKLSSIKVPGNKKTSS